MIVDQVVLAGDAGRFKCGAADPFDLASWSGPPATIGPMPDGKALEVGGIALLLETDDVEQFLSRSHPAGRQQPLFEVSLVKEMFRGLFKDPYAHRVHTVAGYEDFQRGESQNIKPFEYEGIATLVSVGLGIASWNSGIYQLATNTNFIAFAWDVAASRQTHRDAFEYSLAVDLWNAITAVNSSPDSTVTVANQLRPDAPMRHEQSVTCHAFRVRLDCEVRDEAAFHEQHIALRQDTSLGTPVLRSFHLLEPVPQMYSILSLLELQVRSREFIVHRGTADAAPRRITAVLDLPCHLGRGESISIRVQPNLFTRFEAWLVATDHTRPPVVKK